MGAAKTDQVSGRWLHGSGARGLPLPAAVLSLAITSAAGAAREIMKRVDQHANFPRLLFLEILHRPPVQAVWSGRAIQNFLHYNIPRACFELPRLEEPSTPNNAERVSPTTREQ